MSTQIALTTLDVPSTFCFQSWQQAWPVLAGLLQASFAAELQTVNFGNTTPAATDRDKPLFLTNPDGTPQSGAWYAFANGSWLAKHPLSPGIIMLWDGLEADITTLDGGEAGTITTTTGPFWQRLTAMDARVPLGVGTLPGGTAVAVGDVGGAETVTLDLENIPSHDHGIPNKKLIHQTLTSGTLEQTGGNDLSVTTFKADGGKSDGTTKPHSNLPPYRGIFYIKRTARLYLRAP